MDRRGQAVADRDGPDRDPGGGAPRVGRRVIGQLDGRAGRSSRGGSGRLPGAAGRATPGQPSSDACGSQSKVSSSPASSTIRLVGRQEVEERGRAASFCRRVAPPPATTSGTWASTRSQTVAASSASSTPDPISSTIERGSGRERDGMPSAPARARSRPPAEPRTMGQRGQTDHRTRASHTHPVGDRRRTPGHATLRGMRASIADGTRPRSRRSSAEAAR